MDSSPRYTLEGARREIARRDCEKYEAHTFDVVTDSLNSIRLGKPVELRCAYCETSWKVGEGSTEIRQINDALVESGTSSPLGLQGVADLILRAEHGDDLRTALLAYADKLDQASGDSHLIADELRELADE